MRAAEFGTEREHGSASGARRVRQGKVTIPAGLSFAGPGGAEMPDRRSAAAPGRGLPSGADGVDVGVRMRVPERLRGLGWELPRNFLGLDERASDLERARAVILPVPYEATTSFGGGTRGGPEAILSASRYIELYDQELDQEPYEVGIATLPALELTGAGPEEAHHELRQAYDALLDALKERFVVVLGGEHSITSAPVLAWTDRLKGRRLSVLQLDAHADLRPEYEGTRYSHASVMHRIRERADLIGVGVRALTREERQLARNSDEIRLFLAEEIQDGRDWIDRVLDRLMQDVYITVDVDCFDPSLVPATGTPEPGGLTWYPVLDLLRHVFRERNVVGCDVVELAPIPGLHAPNFLVAKLVYKLIGYKFFV